MLLTAAAAGTAPANPQAVDALLGCRAIADATQRLACYDSATADLQSSVQTGEVVVIDRARAQAANREAFGLQLPSLGMLAPSLTPDEIDSQTDTIAAVREVAEDRWVVTLTSGAVWRQTDGRMRMPPKVGATVLLTKGALGGFFLKVGSQPAVKARREI
jgi:hypothetical protein